MASSAARVCSCGRMWTDSDLPCTRRLPSRGRTCGSSSAPLGALATPIRPFLAGSSAAAAPGLGTADEAERRRPGEVGGRASGAELTEWALRLWVWVWVRGAGADWGERVFVMDMVTEKGSPAKYEDWEGVTTTRRAVSGSGSALAAAGADMVVEGR